MEPSSARSATSPVVTEIPRFDGVAPIPEMEPAPRREGRRFPIVNVVLFLLTLFATTMAGALANGAEVSLWQPASLVNLVAGLSFSLPLMAILLAHEMGHYLTSRHHGVNATLPFFIPGPWMVPLPGTLGAFIRMKSLPRSRRAMFDIGAAGPWAGFIVALIATAIGLRMSQVSPLDPSQGGIDFGNSIIFWVLSRVLLGVNPNTVEISLHPLALAGWYGIFVTTLNLLPVGQLDGGHVAYALFGPRGHRLVSRLAWLGCLGLAVVPLVLGFEFWPGWFLWFLIVIALGLGHPSTGDIETPLRGPRRLAAWATVGLFIITFVPVPLSIVTPKAPVVIPPSEGPRYSVMYRVASSGAWRPHAALPYSNLIR